MASTGQVRRPRRLVAGLLAAALLATAGLAYGQSANLAYDPAQLPSFKGVLKQYTLSPRGDIDGLILTDGTEVKVPPHLSPQIVYAIKPGDTIDIRGLKARALPLVLATSVRNDATGLTVVDDGGPAAFDRGEEKQVTARIVQPLHGPRGETNGALLDTGLTIHFPPVEAERSGIPIEAGSTVSVRGPVNDTVLGSVMEVHAIGASPDRMTELPPPGPGGGPKPPPAPLP